MIAYPSLTKNGRLIPAPEPLDVDGMSKLKFIDDTSDTFFNTFRHVKFSKSCSKCYLIELGNRNVPYQLIYRNGNVYQYAAYDLNRFRLVQQNSQMKDEEVANFLKLPEGLSNSSFQFTGSGRAPGIYRDWESKLETAIIEGNISIDELLRFFYIDGNKNKGFKVDRNLQNFWHAFYTKHQRDFF